MVNFRLITALALLGATLLHAAPDTETVLSEARRLVREQRLPEARVPLEQLLAAQPGLPEATLLLARVNDRTGRRDEALALLEPLSDRFPEDPRIIGLYGGICMLRAGELGLSLRAIRLARRGRELLEKAVALAPDEIAYREGLVDFYRQAPGLVGGDVAKARFHADAVARLDPVRGAAWQASILVQEKKFPEALAACDAALRVKPDDYIALFTLGRTVAESGLRLPDGEAALRRCFAVVPRPSEPSHAGVWYWLGLIAEKRRDPAAARAAYAKALEMEPSFNRPAEALRRLDGKTG
ncbi:MAG: tetratricopeptide repeat protein [Verrucomicrobia bacterium]|nr:tetratricopeptide repeat protein [Verrucomicrobiota bacterium]